MPEEFALRLLGEAVGHLEETERWEMQNQRRLALIRKSSTTTFSAEEGAELAALQLALDQRLEVMDDRLLAELERMKKAVADLPTDSPQ